MTRELDAYADSASAYALGALDETERREFERHLETCAECTQAVEDYRQTLTFLPYELARQEPPADARAALLATARAHARSAQPSRRPWLRLPAWQSLRWAAVGLLIAGLLAWNLSLRDTERPGGLVAGYERVIDLDGTGTPGADGRLYVAHGGQTGQLMVSGLAPLPPDRIYQLWFARPGHPITTGGPFRVNANGEALAAMVIPGPLDQVTAIAVTEEAAPGKLQDPTGRHLLDGKP
jgi:anti-sigma-K factor RskA